MILEDGEPLYLYGVFRFKRGSGRSATPARSFMCLGYRICGDSYFHFKGADGKNRDLYVPQHSAILIGNDINYSQESSGEDVIAVHFDIMDGSKRNMLELLTYSNSKILDEQFLKLYETWDKKNVGYRTKCMSILYKILYLTATDGGNDGLFSENMEKGIRHITSGFADPSTTVKSAANAACVSEVYFRRMFTRVYGVAPSRYIVGLRIAYAKELLQSGYYSVSEVAAMSGFSDPKYFCTCFKHEIGVSPGKYKG